MADVADRDATAIFTEAIQTFELSLSGHQKDTFHVTTQDQVKFQILKMQDDQEKSRTMQNLPRVYPFLESFSQFDQVCREVRIGAGGLSAFIWGPTKYALQAANEDAAILDTILDTYHKFGRKLPLLAQHKSLIRDQSVMKTQLAYMYQDLLTFHAKLLSLFKERIWKRIFHANLKDLKSEFESIAKSFEEHGQLLAKMVATHESRRAERANQRMNDHFVASTRALDDLNNSMEHLALQHEGDRSERLKRDKESEAQRREDEYLKVLAWIAAPHQLQGEYHDKLVSTRDKFPATAKWILANNKMWPWINEESPPQSILWMNGKKGAGKTILASHIIEHCKTKRERITSHFYCREKDDRQNTCLAMCKSLLRQLLTSHRNLLPFCNDKRKNGGAETLEDLSAAKSLVDLFCDIDLNQYVIIDGLDECAAAERKYIVELWNEAVKRCDTYRPGKLRVLLVSTDQADTRKMMHSASILDLGPDDNRDDIRNYVVGQLAGLKAPNRLRLSEEDAQIAEALICARSDGMFLFASLVMENLMAQPTVAYFKLELKNDAFPNDLKAAYDRIIKRLNRDLHPNTWTIAVRIFGWLACAKRPLKMHEIQAALALGEDEGEVPNMDYYNNRIKDDIREIGESLIHVLPGCRIEFSHSTAREHVIESEKINVKTVEYELTTLCMRYLSMPCFVGKRVASDYYIDGGIYAFQDYAVSQWHRHIRSIMEDASAIFEDGEEGRSYQHGFAIALSRFVGAYRTGLTAEPEQSKSKAQSRAYRQQQQQREERHDPTEQLRVECAAFQHYGFHDDLLLIWTHIYKHQNADFKTRNKVSIPELSAALTKIREALAVRVGPAGTLEEFYGSNLFKCPRVTCDYFYEGFATCEGAEKHNNRHDRPFQCPIAGCAIAPFGFSTNKDLERHVRAYHPDEGDAASAPLAPFAQLGRRVVEETKFQCEICKQNFTRGANLKAHRDSHFNIRSYQCGICGRAFTRANDRTRHERTLHQRRVGK